MIKKIDLVMWTKNGAETLPFVLKRIAEVIPEEVVHKRVIADDESKDDSAEIAKSFGWDVIPNEGHGISDGANTVLRNVESEYFVSFEQDLLLARNWWHKIPPYLSNQEVAVASGVRLPDRPLVLRSIQEYAMERQERTSRKSIESFLYGKTLDNTIYRTRVVRAIGGFPSLRVSAGVDNILAEQVHLGGFEWKVDYDVISTHLRNGLKQELAHSYWYGKCASTAGLLSRQNADVKSVVLRFAFSPLRGLDIAIKKNTPQAILIYPLIRLAVLRGVSDGLRRG